ncbi:hypothetical protein Y474_03200 [Listeria monocytogenes]|nr:hypothetical protein [Listeria monocytogenes]EAD0081618.1 hypothetical protein [Listeria monocytogenes]EAD1316084.1 hypothetical protein [Listeria monocytogenes]EAD3654444.1 hypothetical protein [Listeria monocytogenes]EAD3660421.1 hypothetical protein [Listeria monocytogenes]
MGKINKSRMISTMKGNMNPTSEEVYLEYELFNELESIFVAFGNRKKQALAFVYADRENEIFHFAPTPFSDMSHSRFYVFLPKPELEHYIVNELADFEMGDYPIIVVYDLEQTENKIRVAHFEYNQMDKRYEPIVDIDKIKKLVFILRLCWN